jgi:hypothetical protein
MMQISSTHKSVWLSPRTADYVAALIREGDSFDYCKWLQKTCEREVQAAQAFAGSVPGEAAATQCNSIQGQGWRGTPPPAAQPLRLSTVLRGMALRQTGHADGDETSEARTRRRLENVVHAWGDFQSSRARDAVYGYLEAVFAIVAHYKVRRRTRKLLRHAFEFAELPFDENANPFTAIIRCTSADNVDSKTISKWARALRYVARYKAPGTRVKAFMKEAGGVNACADGYARCCAPDRRQSSHDKN